jgi:Barstar (barnase inhibitor)
VKRLRRAVSLAEVRREHPQARVVAGAGSKREAIAAFYRAVEAPAWAAPNLDGLADVLGDLSWLPAGGITLAWVDRSALPAEPRRQITRVLEDTATESADGPHPVIVYLVG